MIQFSRPDNLIKNNNNHEVLLLGDETLIDNINNKLSCLKTNGHKFISNMQNNKNNITIQGKSLENCYIVHDLLTSALENNILSFDLEKQCDSIIYSIEFLKSNNITIKIIKKFSLDLNDTLSNIENKNIIVSYRNMIELINYGKFNFIKNNLLFLLDKPDENNFKYTNKLNDNNIKHFLINFPDYIICDNDHFSKFNLLAFVKILFLLLKSYNKKDFLLYIIENNNTKISTFKAINFNSTILNLIDSILIKIPKNLESDFYINLNEIINIINIYIINNKSNFKFSDNKFYIERIISNILKQLSNNINEISEKNSNILFKLILSNGFSYLKSYYTLLGFTEEQLKSIPKEKFIKNFGFNLWNEINCKEESNKLLYLIRQDFYENESGSTKTEIKIAKFESYLLMLNISKDKEIIKELARIFLELQKSDMYNLINIKKYIYNDFEIVADLFSDSIIDELKLLKNKTSINSRIRNILNKSEYLNSFRSDEYNFYSIIIDKIKLDKKLNLLLNKIIMKNTI